MNWSLYIVYDDSSHEKMKIVKVAGYSKYSGPYRSRRYLNINPHANVMLELQINNRIVFFPEQYDISLKHLAHGI